MLPKPEYSRKLNRSTLTLTITKEDYESEIDCIEMFHYNKIPYFLHMDTQKENISLRCSYDITGRHSLDSLLKYKTASCFGTYWFRLIRHAYMQRNIC